MHAGVDELFAGLRYGTRNGTRGETELPEVTVEVYNRQVAAS